MAYAKRFVKYHTLIFAFCCWVLQSRPADAVEQKILLKEPDDQWKGWETMFGNWRLSSAKGYVVCGTGGSGTIDWLVTPFISLPPSVTNVQVKMKYNLQTCATLAPPCDTKITLLKKDQDDKLPVPHLQKDPFADVIGTETPDAAKLTNGRPAASAPKITSIFTANVRKNGVYIAVRVQSACMALFSFEVSYRICASKGINLMKFPETQPPTAGSPKVNVTGTCVKHTLLLPSQPSTLYAFCDSNGTWSADANISCVCMSGYQPNFSVNLCEVCPKGTYKRRNGTESCIKCPLHSSQDTPPVRCSCDKGYYRTIGDDGQSKCTYTSFNVEVGITELLVLFACCSLAAVLVFVLNKRWKKKKQEATERTTVSAISLPSITEIGANQRPVEYDEIPDETADAMKWEFSRKDLKLVKPLGSGEFGQVYKGLAIGLHESNNSSEVAVKLLKENAGQREMKEFLTEIRLMRELESHPHVVKLLACCTLKEPYLAILEYLPYGDLLGFLRRSRGKDDKLTTGELRPNSSLKSNDLIKIAWMIADGMTFLASHKIVHRDLAARNVLVGENITCKISDFGLARNVSDNIYSRKSKAKLPIKWMPPETIFLGESTSKSDVWSYGVVLWEVFTIGDVPYPHVKVRDLPAMLEKGYRMNKPKHLSTEIFSVVLDCWNYNPDSRPTFDSLAVKMNVMLRNHTNYVNLDAYDDELYVNFEMIKGN